MSNISREYAAQILNYAGIPADVINNILTINYKNTLEPIYTSGVIILNEIISLYYSNNTNDFYNFLNNIFTPNDIIFNQLTNEAKEENRKIEIARYQQQISKVLGKCSKCGSGALKSLQVQMRAGDEGATTFILCSNCNNVKRL